MELSDDDIKKEISLIFKKPITGDYKSNYLNVRDICWTPYKNFVELDSLRNEICYCLIIGINQASIALTNHLMEKFLLHSLIYKEFLDNKCRRKQVF